MTSTMTTPKILPDGLIIKAIVEEAYPHRANILSYKEIERIFSTDAAQGWLRSFCLPKIAVDWLNAPEIDLLPSNIVYVSDLDFAAIGLRQLAAKE